MTSNYCFRLLLLIGLVVVPKPAPAAAPPAEWVNDLRPLAASEWNYPRAAHLLERAGFGGTPEEVEHLARMTPEAAVDYLVDYEKIDSPGLPPFQPSGIYPHGFKLAPLETIGRDALLTGLVFGVPAAQEGKLPLQPGINEFYTLLISEHAEMRRAVAWWGERMLLSPRPLEEKLALFWHNHFATSQEKVLNYELMLRQIQLFRDHGNGSFRELLIAVAQDPAMLLWLDNNENRKGKPNENFAREVMELFCLGEGQGYTEADIRELARAFTGWGFRPQRRTNDEPTFVASPELHDARSKSFLGATGNFDGTNAIDIILAQPAAPQFVTRKLYRWFVRQEISPAVNRQLAEGFARGHFELKPVLRTLFLSRDFYSQPSLGAQFKAPVQFLVSTSRKLGLKALPGVPEFTETAGALGQVLFYPPNVAGWPGRETWINPATLLTRANYAHGLLFPETVPDIAHDKVIAEGFRRIPQFFPQYGLAPQMWNDQLGRMEPVSPPRYEEFLARLEADEPGATPAAFKIDPGEKSMSMNLSPYGGGMSKAAQMADTEYFNLAIGVYTGFVEAFNRVKPIPRDPAVIDFLAMARASGAHTAAEAVDYLARRFLSIDLQPPHRAAIIDFLQGELGGPQLDLADSRLPAAWRRTVHLVLSSPEYQLD